jgi:polysaccharide chain length determinant protein (PEP-CTERM system associated)
MLPGKSYSPEDVLRILRARVWIVLVPMAVVTAVAALLAKRMPDYYRAETSIVVVPQRVPESYVRPTVTTRIGEQLQTITPMIQSRTRLERIIQDLDLFPNERRAMAMEDVVELMRANIRVATIRDDAFFVSYVGRDPKQVTDVTNRLASLYIDESIMNRQRQAEGTDEFLESQLVEAKQSLQEKEKALEVYRKTHALELPSQVESNLQQVRNAQDRVRAQMEIIGRLEERKVTAERTLTDLDSQTGGAVGSESPAGSGTTAQQLAAAEANVQALQARGYRPGHPDFDTAQRSVRDLERRLHEESASVARNSPTVPAAELIRRRRIEEAKETIADLVEQIARAKTEQEYARADGQAAQARIDSLPTRESELTELMRDYSTLDQTYKNLLAKKEESKIAANLERQQIGEQFRILDRAQVPERPFSPNRPQIASMAAGLGLVMGLVIAAFLEYRDRGFRTDQEVSTVLELPVLASVPLMRSETEERRQKVRQLSVDFSCGGIVIVCTVLAAYTLFR